MKENKLYFKKGQVANAAIGSILALVVGVGVVVIVIVFIGVLGGQTYTLSEAQLTGIGNTTNEMAISTAINESILSGFTTLQTTSSYVPLIVLAVIIFVVLTLILGFTSFSGRGMSSGGAL